MALVDLRDMVGHAYRHGYAVPGFHITSLEALTAVVAAAEHTGAPAVLSLAAHRPGAPAFEHLAAAATTAAARARVPMAVQAGGGGDADALAQAINRGCNGLLLDAAAPYFNADPRRLQTAVELAHGCGVAVEGIMAAAPGEGGNAVLERAADFVERTGVDVLALAGRSHGGSGPDAGHLAALQRRLERPLALHGDAVPDAGEQLSELIAQGAARVHHQLLLDRVAGERVAANRAAGASGYEALMAGVEEALQAAAEHAIGLCGAAGRAADAAHHCRPWTSVQHLIFYNVEGAGEDQVAAMMARGRAVLARIPGVRRVVTGRAVAEDAHYRYCWVVELVHQQVIAGYRDHPDHVAFANELFRPIAGNRITIDFAETTGGDG